jgi:hypothetical protein
MGSGILQYKNFNCLPAFSLTFSLSLSPHDHSCSSLLWLFFWNIRYFMLFIIVILVLYLVKKPCTLEVLCAIYFSFIITIFKQKQPRVLVNAVRSAPVWRERRALKTCVVLETDVFRALEECAALLLFCNLVTEDILDSTNDLKLISVAITTNCSVIRLLTTVRHVLSNLASYTTDIALDSVALRSVDFFKK